MGYFAVAAADALTSFEVEACHLSFWVLSKRVPWPGYRYCFDVGLQICPKTDLRRLKIALPFDSEDQSLVDLSPAVLDSQFSPLIFGKPVTVKDDCIEYDGSSVGTAKVVNRVIPIDPRNCTPVADTQFDKGFSVWTVELVSPAKAGETTYIRFRVPVSDPWRIWASKGWGYARRGMIVDFRVADVREFVLLGEGEFRVGEVPPIKSLNLFLVAPSYFVPRHVSPALHYSRLLEPKVWQLYLASCGSYDRDTKFSIHQWRSKTLVNID
jgi:hypothetical protein